MLTCQWPLGKVSIKENIKSFGIFHTWGGGLPDFQNFFRRKKKKIHEKYKDDQNGLIHPEKCML